MSPITFATEPWDESRGNPKAKANSIENATGKNSFEPEVRILEILRPGGKTLESFVQMYASTPPALFTYQRQRFIRTQVNAAMIDP
jgi:hypothetical protein